MSRSAANRRPKPKSLQLGGIRRVLLVFLGLIGLLAGLYALAGFYGVPWLADRWLTAYRTAHPGRPGSVERIRFNPFTLKGTVVGLEIGSDTGPARLSVDRIAVAINPASLRERRPILDSVRVERPRLELRSLAELSALGRRARSSGLYRLGIGALALADGELDLGSADSRSLELTGLELSMTGYDGHAGTAGDFDLEAMTAQGTTLSARGTLVANLERADGQLNLGALDLGTVGARLGGVPGAVDLAGQVDVSGAFGATSLLSTPTLGLDDASLTFTGLALQPAAGLGVTADRATAAANLGLSAAADGIALSGRLEARDLALDIVDARVEPAQTFAFADARILASSAAGDGLSLSFGGAPQGAGELTVTLRTPPATGPRRVSIEAHRLPAAMLSAYAAAALDRPLTDGDADLDLDYTLTGNRVAGTLRVTARGLAFAPPAADQAPATGGPPLDLASALLENRDGVIGLDLPFASSTTTVGVAAAVALKARLATVTATPFDTLAPLTGGTTASGTVSFLPGDPALGDRALATIAQLAEALEARPKLGIRVHGGYDRQADRDALARQQIELHVQLATAGPGAGGGRPPPVDFGSPRARDVLDEFAGERLPPGRVAELAKRFDCEGEFVPLCERAYYELIFDALVENEAIAPTTLSRLGRFRAQTIADALRQQGIAADRVEIAAGNDAVESPFGVGLPVELTTLNADGPAPVR